MSNIKVTYFNLIGLGESIRWLLKYGNIEFEDIRVEADDWPALKESLPFGQLPIYEENGKAIGQSFAILRYLAKKVKLVGNNDWEDLEINAVADTINDLKQKVGTIPYDGSEEIISKTKKNVLSEAIPYYLEKLDKRVAENNGYLAVNKLTWVDILFTAIFDFFQLRLDGEIVIKNYKNLSALREKVREIPAIKEWIKIRPASDL